MFNLTGKVKDITIIREMEHPEGLSPFNDLITGATFDRDGNFINVNNHTILQEGDSIHMEGDGTDMDMCNPYAIYSRTMDGSGCMTLQGRMGTHTLEYVCGETDFQTSIQYDRQKRLISVSDNGYYSEMLRIFNTGNKYEAEYTYRDNERFPTGMSATVTYADEQYIYNVTYKYILTDQNGNWILREACDADTGEPRYTETREIEYYPSEE